MFYYYGTSAFGVVLAANGILRWTYDANSASL